MADNDMHYNRIYSQAPASETGRPAPGSGSNPPAYPGNSSSPGTGGSGSNSPAPDAPGSDRPGSNNPPSGSPGSDRPGDPTPPPEQKPSAPSQPPQLPDAPGSSSRPWMPPYPAWPGYPTVPSQNYGQVRFLNASTGSSSVNVSIDGSSYFAGAGFASLSAYDWISDGFHTVTIRSASGLRSILLQQTFPFLAGQKVTLVLTDAADGSLDLVRVVDTGCSNLPSNSACFRFANMTWPGSYFDLMLGNEMVFRNISYQSVSSYKQAIAGNYQFTVVAASGYAFIRELPLIILGAEGVSVTAHESILIFSAAIAAGNDYTAYLIGNTWSTAGLQILLAQD
ncbi:MAG: DUF4397 domain-containing protein [Clostridiales bacterium]|nr:DUF4397 domain-containing protein [Clostridiales bacterium]